MEIYVDGQTFVEHDLLPFSLVAEEDLSVKVLEQYNPSAGTHFYYIVTGKPEGIRDFQCEIKRTFGEGRVSDEDTYTFVNLGRPIEVNNQLKEYPDGTFYTDFMGIMTAERRLVIDKKANLNGWVKEGDAVLEFLPCDGDIKLRATEQRVFFEDKVGKLRFRYAQRHEVLIGMPQEFVVGTKVAISNGVVMEFISDMNRCDTRTEINKKIRDKYKMGKDQMKIKHFPLPVQYCNRQIDGRLDRQHVIFDPKGVSVQIRTLAELAPDYEDFYGGALPSVNRGSRLMEIRNF